MELFFWPSYVSASQYNSKLQPKRCNAPWFIYFYIRSTCFSRFHRPSSGAHNCTYSCKYCQPILLLAARVEEMELRHTSLLTACEQEHLHVCWQLASRSKCSYSQAVSKPVWLSSISPKLAASNSIGWKYLKLYVQLCAPGDGRRNRLKPVERL